jgi:hypothetical protein
LGGDANDALLPDNATALRALDLRSSCFEGGLAGNAPLNKSVHAVLASIPRLFGTDGDAARPLIELCTARRWPLYWALGFNNNHGGEATTYVPLRARVATPRLAAAAGLNVTGVERSHATFEAAWEAARAVRQAKHATRAWAEQVWANLSGVLDASLVVTPLSAGSRGCEDTDRCVGVGRSGDCVCYP